MELFSELYCCYYQIVNEILNNAYGKAISRREMEDIVSSYGYDESNLYLIPKLINGDWSLLLQNGKNYQSKLKHSTDTPLTKLQKAWIKTLLLDPRISLFFSEEQQKELLFLLKDVEPLFLPDDFHYYDQYADGDNFSDPNSITIFRTILKAIHTKQYLHINFLSRHNKRVQYSYLPCRLEYSAKNNKFRLLALTTKNRNKKSLETVNLGRIESVKELNYYSKEDINLNSYLRYSYTKHPIRLMINNERNTLERAMLHFANYEKKTTKIDDKTYECFIYYNKDAETELLIEILSFGPTIKVLGPESFVTLVKERIEKQKNLINSTLVSPSPKNIISPVSVGNL